MFSRCWASPIAELELNVDFLFVALIVVLFALSQSFARFTEKL